MILTFKNFNRLFFFCLLFSFFISGCKKSNDFASNGTATINVINGVTNASSSISLMLRMNGGLNTSGILNSNNNSKVNFGSNTLFYAPAATVDVDVMSGKDTSKLSSNSYALKRSGIYTLLVSGTQAALENTLIEETSYPYIRLDKTPPVGDSVINIRFINLASNTLPLDIKITGGTSNEVTGLGYKNVSAWKAYVAKSTNTSYSFQIIESGTVLLTQSFSITESNRFRNVALVVRGLKGGASPNQLAVSTINYF